jgi:serine/threonine protein kinase
MNSVRPGDVLAGKYRVERVLGQGGMGYVVAARHLQLDQLVAMKFLRRGALEEGEATMRFQREAKASVKLRNEHVARVFDVGTLDSGEPYMVMEYLEGCDLSALAKQRGAIPVGEAVEYIMQSCEALAEAHSFGIVHRDIKLANLFVTRGLGGAPLVKVLDFGISKTNPFGESEHEMTRTASMLGSPRFMSPEQMRDPRAVDARSDLWSLGVVLFRLVGGKAPFEAETLGQLLSMVMHEMPTRLGQLRGDLPPGFDAVVARCLEKDPAARFQNVAELAYALAPYAMDPMRARATADRVAATLSVAQIPPAITSSARMIAPPLSDRRPSGPPGALDTGTAAWGGTRAGGAPSRASIVWVAAAMVTVFAVGGGLLAKLHFYDTAARDAAAAQPAQPAQPVQPTASEPPQAPPTVITAAPPPIVVPAPPPTTMVLGASPEPPAPKPAATEEVKRHVAPAPAARKAPRPQAPAASKDEGIPSTRD